ncbi:thioredoxin [Clostridium transplantifaecale]|uniref:thioredoxin n=1 Tax=Clostridium transplantifaecale TaxID=2479838 RepID=UPI000F62EE1D|nr:thioredoxin [Clostridium transplantifaecale]
METRFTSENFETEVLKSNIPVLVDFYADWCGPCKLMAPVVEQLASEYDGRIKVGKVNIDESADLAMKYGVMSIPTLIVFSKGQVIRKEVGVQTKATIVKAINQAI